MERLAFPDDNAGKALAALAAPWRIARPWEKCVVAESRAEEFMGRQPRVRIRVAEDAYGFAAFGGRSRRTVDENRGNRTAARPLQHYGVYRLAHDQNAVGADSVQKFRYCAAARRANELESAIHAVGTLGDKKIPSPCGCHIADSSENTQSVGSALRQKHQDFFRL